MGAVDKHFDVETMVKRISEAEIDIALICHDRMKVEKAYGALIEAARESEDSKRKATMSVQRILNLKRKCLGNV
jgi:beta-glucosidase-like glycosyl hydrolase